MTLPGKVTELYRRELGDGYYTFCTLPGGFSDEAQWCYHTASWTPEELAPIEAVFIEHMSPTDKRIWSLGKFDDGRLKTYHANGRANLDGYIASTPEELAEKLKGFFIRYKQAFSSSREEESLLNS